MIQISKLFLSKLNQPIKFISSTITALPETADPTFWTKVVGLHYSNFKYFTVTRTTDF